MAICFMDVAIDSQALEPFIIWPLNLYGLQIAGQMNKYYAFTLPSFPSKGDKFQGYLN